MSWNEFLRARWDAIAAWDCLTVEVLTLRGLVRYHVLIVIDLASRRVEIGGIVHEPTGAWMMQAARNLLDAEDGFLTGKTKLIMDRDPIFTAGVRALLRSAGVDVVRLPARSPKGICDLRFESTLRTTIERGRTKDLKIASSWNRPTKTG